MGVSLKCTMENKKSKVLADEEEVSESNEPKL